MSSNWPLCHAARIVLGGGIIAYPTEAVYGMGCDPYNPAAVARLCAIKRRPPGKGLIVIAAHWQQLQGLVDLSQLDPGSYEQMHATWPGPVTWVVPAKISVAPWLRGQYRTLAVRITAHPIARQLCQISGQALVSTSANLSGHAPVTTQQALHSSVRQQMDAVVAGKTGPLTRPTPIRDARTQQIIRQ